MLQLKEIPKPYKQETTAIFNFQNKTQEINKFILCISFIFMTEKHLMLANLRWSHPIEKQINK